MTDKNDISKAIFLGAAYYPEDWDEKEQDRDIEMMVKAGIKIVRMAEFSWSVMEPEEGKYNFEWLHRVIDKLDKNGIKVMLGTPSATPPIWLEEKYPSMMIIDDFGRPAHHGGRRNNCSNNPYYCEYVSKIVEKMAQEFGNDSRVIAWQMDNEIYTYTNSCYCEHCQKAFKEHLIKKYKTIDNLNKRWNLNLFSQHYDNFDQVPLPKPFIWNNPHIRYEWKEFISDSHVDFIKMQADILHRYTNAPIGTDMMPIYGVAYEKISKFVDMIQYNHYHDHKNQIKAAFWFDYLRTFKDIPFWCTETSTCWNGGTVVPHDLRPEGFCTANSWLPIVLGGGANMYWLWRQHWAGHELMHGAVLYSSGRPMHIFDEVQSVAKGFKKAEDFLSNTKVVTDTAMLVSAKSRLLLECQHISETGDDNGDGLLRLYRYIVKSGIRPDIIAPTKDFSSYKLLFAPYLVTLEEENLSERIENWVKEGGILVAGPMTDIRDDIGAHYTDRETGILERLTESKLVQQVPDHEFTVPCQWTDGESYKAMHFLQMFDISDDAEPWVRVTGGFKAFKDKSLVFLKKVGKGAVIVVGALPDDTNAPKILDRIIKVSDTKTFKFEGNIVAAKREGKNQCGIAAQEISGLKGTLYFDGTMTDILTDKIYTEKVEIEPFGTVILRKN